MANMNGDLDRAAAVAAALESRDGFVPACVHSYLRAERTGGVHLYRSIDDVLRANLIAIPDEAEIKSWME